MLRFNYTIWNHLRKAGNLDQPQLQRDWNGIVFLITAKK